MYHVILDMGIGALYQTSTLHSIGLCIPNWCVAVCGWYSAKRSMAITWTCCGAIKCFIKDWICNISAIAALWKSILGQPKCKIKCTGNRLPNRNHTFGDFSGHFEVIRSEHIIHPPRESSFLLLNPPFIIKHVLGSKWQWMPGYNCQHEKKKFKKRIKIK